MKFLTGIVLAGLCSLSFSAHSSPAIGIGSMYDLLLPGENNIVKKVYNSGDTVAFVRVDILEIRLDGKGGEQELVPQKLDGEALNKNRLIATPQRMIIPPSEFQSVRLLWPGTREKERYYRVRFTPVLPEKKNDFGLSEQQLNEYKTSVKAGVNILTGYGSILYVMPEEAVFNTSVSNDAERIIITNAGNATIVIDDIRQCSEVKAECSSPTRAFVIPGRDFTIKKENRNTVRFRLHEAKKSKEFSL
jgi:P pilus assembly chaperone PapD